MASEMELVLKELRQSREESKQMREAMEKAASKPAGRGPAGVLADIDSSYSGWRQGKSSEWPVERLKALGETYGSPAAVDLFCRKPDGSMRLTGMGPYLAKMAGLAAQSVSHQGTLQLLKDQGLWSDSYGGEQFEKEFHVRQAASSHIVKGWDGREVKKTALAENSGQTGGYTVPPQFMTELLTIAAEDGFIEPRAKVVPMNSRTVQWPTLDITTVQSTGTSPYFGGILGSWQPEAATINETEPAFKQTEWTAWDLVLYSVSSNQLLADNGIGLDALLTQLFGAAMTWYKEIAYLQGKGSGSSMPLGILNAPATYVQNRAVSNKFKYADAAAMLSHLQVRSWDDACWIMHQSVIPELILMVDGGVSNTASSTYIPGNRLVWVNPTMTGDRGPAASKLPNAFLNGLPVFFTEKLPSLGTKGDVMLVDWSRYVIGMRLETQVDVSPHFLFRSNQLAWRVVARLDAKPWLNSFITDQSGWQISPYVVLN